MMKKLLLTFILSPAFFALTSANPPEKAKPEALQSWREARFGMFIHWGPVSLTEKEISWSRANSNSKCPNKGPTPVEVYDHLYERFNPTGFNAKEWVAIAKASGMKYIILTAKHCDGFLLWDSKADDYNIMHTPFKHDVCAELAKAAHEAGMKIGWYYSPMDWRDPNCRNEKNNEFVRHMQAELKELLSNYGKIDIMWFDCDGCSNPWDQENTYALVRKLQPGIVINDRLGIGDKGRIIDPWVDFHTPEQTIGIFDQSPWESCMTVSHRGQWSWGGHSDGVKSYEQCLGMLIRCAGADGNMLLDVGPMPTGEIAPEQVGVIKEMGTWLVKYGESIYGTRGGPFKPYKYGVSTYKNKVIYLHILSQLVGKLELPSIPVKIVSSRVLTGGKVTVTQGADRISINLPKTEQQIPDMIIALELDREAKGIEPVNVNLP